MNKTVDYISYFRRYEFLIASAVVILVVFLLSFVLLLPNFNRANTIFRQQADLKQRLDNLKKKDSALVSVDYQYYKDNFGKVSLVLPESKDYVSLFSTFDALEQKFGVSVVRTDFQLGVVSTNSAKLSKAPNSAAFLLPINIEVMGKLPQLLNFIKALSDFSGRFMTLSAAQWTQKGENILLLTLSGKAYFYPLPTTLGSIDTPLPKIDKQTEEILTKIAQIQLSSDAQDLDKVAVGKKDLFQ